MIKKLTQRDKATAKQLFLKVFTDAPWHDHWDEKQIDLYMIDLMDNQNSLSIGYYKDDSLIGLSFGYIYHWWQGTDYFVKELCIDQDHQNQGHGKEFLKELESYLKTIGITAYYLNSERDVDAYHFYLKQGFTELKGNVMLAKSLKE